MTATKLAAVTAPIAKLEEPVRLNTNAISGGWKPKIKPTPRLLENTAGIKRRDGGAAVKSGHEKQQARRHSALRCARLNEEHELRGGSWAQSTHSGHPGAFDIVSPEQRTDGNLGASCAINLRASKPYVTN